VPQQCISSIPKLKQNNKIDALNLSGWLAIDKPKNMTSVDVLAIIKRMIKFKKIGHAGTLDPDATGVLLIAVGEATKLVELAMNKVKRYRFTIKFGQSTDTLDAAGRVLEEDDRLPDESALKVALKNHLGKRMQVPPAYSAIKVNGKRAYDMARENISFELKGREVQLFDGEITMVSSDEAECEITCGRGYYVRSLMRDICKNCGVLGHVSSLRRTKVGKFEEDDAILLEDFKTLVHNVGKPSLENLIRPLDAVLDDILVQQVSANNALKLKQGQKLLLDNYRESDVVLAKCENEIIAICKFEEGLLKPKTVFNL
jgi:tRNA pseudouridine55 synthase